MTENFLHLSVGHVNKHALVLLLAGLVAGCDDTSAPLSFSPEMASFSNEFDFDPLRGPVKDFSQTLFNDKGEVAKRVSGTLSAEGCFDSLELQDLESNSGIALVLDANYYLDAQTQQKKLRLQGKCQLAEMPASGISWETDDNGFIVSAHGKDMEVKYRYDTDGYPLGKTTVAGEQHLSITATPSADKRKRMDYTAVSLLNDQPLGNVKQTCQYDRHNNPEECELEIVDASKKPAVARKYRIKNSIEYY